MQFVRYRSFDDIPLSGREWDDLVMRSRSRTVFQCHFWINNWWKHFGADYELYFVAQLDENKIVGFAPLMIDNDGILRFIGDSNSDYLNFVFPKDYATSLESLFSFLRQNSSNWRVIHLRNLRRDHIAVDLQALTRAVGLYPWINYSVVAPYLLISDNDEELNALMSKYSFRRAERSLRAQGDLTFRFLSPDFSEATYLELFARQHLSRCDAAGRKSTFEDPRYLPFVRSLLQDPDSLVSFSGLFLGDRPIAFHFGFEFDGTLIWYKPSFDVSIVHGSPGVSLILHLIRDARNRHLKELDFTIGAEPFKNRFCSGFHMIDEYRVHKTGLRCTVERGYWQLRRKIKRWIRSAK